MLSQVCLFPLQASKNDWISGDIAVPRFHCPRCRDHWYGISAYPCNEELARLIREGKWHTRKEGNLSPQQDSEAAKTRDKRPGTSNASKSYSNNLPGINRKRRGSGIDIKKSDRTIDFLNPNLKAKTKKNRRISFKLDNEDSEMENSGSSGLLHDETRQPGRRLGGNGKSNRKWNNKEGDGSDNTEVRNIESSSSASDINSDSSTTLLKSSLKKKSNNDHLCSLQVTNNGDTEKHNDTYGTKNGERTMMGGGKKSDIETDLQTNKGFEGNGKGQSEKDGKNSHDRFSSLTGDVNGRLSGNANNKDITGNVDHTLYGNQRDNRTSVGNGPSNGQNGQGINGKESVSSKEGRRNRRGNPDSLGSSRYSSRTSLHGGSQRWSEDGDGNKKRELVSGKGFMRASSPSQSEWGDPTHARVWASNTASSSCVSLAQLGKDKEDKDVEEVVYLPPIKNHSKNSFTSSDLLDGFNFTRAFTFSYH